MEIDYKKAFEKLVGQIKLEEKWAKASEEAYPTPFDRGALFAYRSMLELASKLEDGTFNFEE